jgi:hypothetical protein
MTPSDNHQNKSGNIYKNAFAPKTSYNPNQSWLQVSLQQPEKLKSVTPDKFEQKIFREKLLLNNQIENYNKIVKEQDSISLHRIESLSKSQTKKDKSYISFDSPNHKKKYGTIKTDPQIFDKYSKQSFLNKSMNEFKSIQLDNISLDQSIKNKVNLVSIIDQCKIS